MEKSIRNFTFGLAIILIWTSCQTKIQTNLSINNIIPAPIFVKSTGGTFELTKNTNIYVNPELMKLGNYLVKKLGPSTGIDLKIKTTQNIPSTGILLCIGDENEALGVEGYEINVTEKLIIISGNEAAGVFRGIQTLRQILPAKIEASSKQSGPWEIATGKIIDYPEYEFRGAMLDVARHFFSVEDIKRYIDLLSGFKINALHIHLTDDQGWRIEIKSWPKLTEIGGQTEVGGTDGGFLTQEEYKDIVQYAADRYMLVIPEIDVPSHTYAALSAYPELNCDGKTPVLTFSDHIQGKTAYTGTEVGFCTICTNNEITYKFLDDVIREIAAITPGPYIHLGGDESHVTPLEDYIPFFNRAQQIVINNEKIMIGWDEVANAKLDSTTIIQYWDDDDNTIMGIKQGAKVIMSPAHRTYMDMKYNADSGIGNDWAGMIEVDYGYDWDPAAIHDKISRKNILGIESPLWTEFVTNMNDLEYLLFPRIMGYAEIGRSPRSLRNWESYKIRLGNQANRLNHLEIGYYPSTTVPWVE